MSLVLAGVGTAISWTAIGQWFAVLVLALIAWRITRGGGGSAVSELSKANEVLTKAVHDRDARIAELGAEVRDLRVEVAKLRERTDVAQALIPAVDQIVAAIGSSEERSTAALDRAEARAVERHGKSLNVLQLIADRLGPEPNGALA